MHVRFTTALGMEVVDEESQEMLGAVTGIVIHPDTGKVEGFFVTTRHFLSSQTLFLSTPDICRWGLRITVRHPDVVSPLEDHVRLQTLLEENRPLIGQRMRTESGKDLGKCADVQFDTLHFVVEWLFPKTFFRWGTPLPITQVVEVRKDAVIIRDAAVAVPETGGTGVPILEMPGAA